MKKIINNKKIEVDNYIRFNGVFGKVCAIEENHIVLDRDILSDGVLTRKINFDELEKYDFEISNDSYNLITDGDVLLLLDKKLGIIYKSEVLYARGIRLIRSCSSRELLDLEYELITKWHIELLAINTKEQFNASSYFFAEIQCREGNKK